MDWYPWYIRGAKTINFGVECAVCASSEGGLVMVGESVIWSGPSVIAACCYSDASSVDGPASVSD